MKKNENNFFNLFDAEEDSEITDNTENDIAGGQFSFFDNEEPEEPIAEPIEEKPKKKHGFFKKKKTPNFFFDEENGYEVAPAFDSGTEEGEFTKDADVQDSEEAEIVPVGSVPLTEDAEFTVENTVPAERENTDEEIVSEDAAPAESAFTVENVAPGSANVKNTEENSAENNVSDKSAKPQEETEKADIPVFKNDDATEKMVSILEDDVSSEIVDDEPLDIPPQSPKKREYEDLSGLKNFRDIKKMSVMEKFETPYVYSSKNDERVRYRLSLPSDKNPRKTRRTRDIISMAITLIAAFIIAMFLRSFVFVFATVDGPSMQPTLETGEKIFVTRYTYYFQEIERGDIIVCDFPSDMYPDHYVKRVIGLGGEKVRITGGVVYINDEPLSEDYTISSASENMDEVVVPEGCVFVMGDNRVNSTDSRKLYIGPINKKLIIGKARCILFPFSKIGTLESEK